MAERTSLRPGRREFLKGTTMAGAAILSSRVVRGTQANSAVRLGLLGCGGRGTTVAEAMLQSPETHLTAVADIFEDRVQKAKQHFDSLSSSRGRSAIDPGQVFQGMQAFEEMANSDNVDAVIVASPDFLHPQHVETVVAAGKHVYSEKPTGVDVVGVKRFLQAAEQASGRLSLAVGFQIRKAPPFVELIRHIHAGALGKIACGQGYYYTGALNLPEWSGLSAQQRKLRRWYFYRELSGGILVDQGIHVLDIFNWVLKSRPLKASGGGGRKVRSDEGNCWDHYNLTYHYPEGVHVSFSSTQFNRGWTDVCQRFFGSDGVSESHYTGPMRIYGESPWEGAGEGAPNLAEANREKARSFVESITTGRFMNESKQGSESTLTAILGRMAASLDAEVSWDDMMRSNEYLDPGLEMDKLA